MENIVNNIISKISELEKKRIELNSEIHKEKKKIENILTSKPGWDLFIAGYCIIGDKETYCDLENVIKNGLETPKPKNLSTSFKKEKVIIKDYVTWGYDGYEDWIFEITIKKFIEFCSSDDYMQKVIDRYKSIKNCIKKREEQEELNKERELYKKLKEKFDRE